MLVNMKENVKMEVLTIKSKKGNLHNTLLVYILNLT